MILSLEKDKKQDTNKNQVKLKVNDASKKHKKLSTNFEPSDDSDVLNKAFLDKKLSNTEGQISFIEKNTLNIKYTTKKIV